MFLDWNNQYCENDYTTQSNLQIQCNPYQITNGIFYGTRTNHLKINKTLRNKLNQVGERYVKLQDLDERNLRRYK